MDVDDEEDPVPEITKRHFEEAMKFARRFRILRVNTLPSVLYVKRLVASSFGVAEPKIFISAPAPAPVLDSFIRYFENYLFLT
jgi:hypothetical protein